MTQRRRVNLVILGEDRNHSNLAYHFFVQRGWSRDQIRLVKPPHGKGSGAHHVIREFPKELDARRTLRVSTALVALLDEDGLGTDHRIGELKNSCQTRDVEFRRENEPVLIALPKRNVETWLCFLENRPVDETTDYKKVHFEITPKKAAMELAKRCEQGSLGTPPLSSLEQVCDEYRTRIRPAAKGM